MTFVIPQGSTTTSSAIRRPTYISTSTTSIAVTAYAASSNPPSAPTTVANVGPGQSGCTSAPGGTTCTITASAPLGSDTFTIAAYSGANATGSVLSQATFSQVVTAGMSPIGVTLNGTLAQVQLSLRTPALASGTAATSILDVNGYDASGNLIVAPGSFASTINVSSDSTAVTLSATAVTGPGQPITVTYSGGVSPYTVHFTASATNVNANSIVGTTLAIVPSQGFAVVQYGGATASISNYALNALDDPPTAAFPVSIGATSMNGGSGVTLATSPNGPYAASSFTTTVGSCVINAYSATGSQLGSGFFYLGPSSTCPIAFDTAAATTGDLFIGLGTAIAEHSVSGTGIAAGTIRTISLPPSLYNPTVLAVDSSGTIYVSNGGTLVGTYAVGNNGTAPSTTFNTSGTTVDLAPAASSVVYALEFGGPSGWQVEAFTSGTHTATFNDAALSPSVYAGAEALAVDGAGEVLVGYTLFTPAYAGTYVAAFAGNASGASSPLRTFGGPVTGLNAPVVAGPRILGHALSAPAAAPVAGDMLGYVANRTWTYTATQSFGGGTFTVGLYADPVSSDGISTLVAFLPQAVPGNPFSGGTNVGSLGLQSLPNGYLAVNFSSTASGIGGISGAVPGSPLFVPSSLQVGQTWNPLQNAVVSAFAALTGVSASATVTAVGAVPGMSACPNSPTQGATVQYTVTLPNTNVLPVGSVTQTGSVSYVPGCGITDFVDESGTEFVLSSVGSQNLGVQSTIHQDRIPSVISTLHALWKQVFIKKNIGQ